MANNHILQYYLGDCHCPNHLDHPTSHQRCFSLHNWHFCGYFFFLLWFMKKEIQQCESWIEDQKENDRREGEGSTAFSPYLLPHCFLFVLSSAFALRACRCLLFPLFTLLNLLLYEPQKKKHSKKTPATQARGISMWFPGSPQAIKTLQTKECRFDVKKGR